MTEAFDDLKLRARVRDDLRKHPDSTLDEIAERTDIPKHDVHDVINIALHGFVYIEKGKIRLL